VTVAVYKNLNVTTQRTNDHPIFIGPIYLHGNSDTETYAFFFDHLSTRLMNCDSHSLTLGSDEESSMRKSMAHAFHGASLVSCTRHLHENMNRKLDNVLGKRTDLRRALINGVFGDSGLVKCTDYISFDESVTKFESVLQKAPVPVRDYVEQQVLPTLRANLVSGHPGWTNNNCESINHVIKEYVQWRPQQLPDLIQKLRELVTCQYVEADRAICGHGDLMLVPALARH